MDQKGATWNSLQIFKSSSSNFQSLRFNMAMTWQDNKLLQQITTKRCIGKVLGEPRCKLWVRSRAIIFRSTLISDPNGCRFQARLVKILDPKMLVAIGCRKMIAFQKIQRMGGARACAGPVQRPAAPNLDLPRTRSRCPESCNDKWSVLETMGQNHAAKIKHYPTLPNIQDQLKHSIQKTIEHRWA